MKLTKLIVVLLFAVMILLLGLLAASISGCADIANNTTSVHSKFPRQQPYPMRMEPIPAL